MAGIKIVFMGTPEFAVASLDILLKNNYNIVGVITAPDKPAGRGRQIQESAVKKYALEKGLRILQPEKLKDEQFVEELRSLNADLQIVVAFRMLPEVVWNMPKLGTYNLHGSLLPRYRGAAPINWAVINGDSESGVTTFKLQHQIDTGNILFREKVSITDNTTAGELHDALMDVGAKLILKTVNEIEKSVTENSPLNFIEQNDTEATHAPKIFKETCKINWNNNINDIYNLIRGLSPYPAAYSDLINGDTTLSLKIFKAEKEISNDSEDNGSLITDNKKFLKVKCDGGYLNIIELQLQGKKQMNVEDFLRGFIVKENARMI